MPTSALGHIVRLYRGDVGIAPYGVYGSNPYPLFTQYGLAYDFFSRNDTISSMPRHSGQYRLSPRKSKVTTSI